MVRKQYIPFWSGYRYPQALSTDRAKWYAGILSIRGSLWKADPDIRLLINWYLQSANRLRHRWYPSMDSVIHDILLDGARVTDGLSWRCRQPMMLYISLTWQKYNLLLPGFRTIRFHFGNSYSWERQIAWLELRTFKQTNIFWSGTRLTRDHEGPHVGRAWTLPI